MDLTADDRFAIAETIALHGHLFDLGELDRLDELFTADVVYDVSDMGFGALRGVAAVRRVALDLGDGNPVAHHVTNTIVLGPAEAPDEVRTRCKAIAVKADGTCGTATYDDTLRRTDDGWRICHRVIRAHREPLNGAHRRCV